jgi:hypothetical protein
VLTLMLIFLGVVMVACVVGVAVIPRFDRRPPLGGWPDAGSIPAAPGSTPLTR